VGDTANRELRTGYVSKCLLGAPTTYGSLGRDGGGGSSSRSSAQGAALRQPCNLGLETVVLHECAAEPRTHTLGLESRWARESLVVHKGSYPTRRWCGASTRHTASWTQECL
jgi:hypothetical protein